MVILLEGLVMCFILLLICVIGIANGPVGAVFFYEKDVQNIVLVKAGIYNTAGICLIFLHTSDSYY